MRQWKPERVLCQVCGKVIRSDPNTGGWRHVEKVPLRDPSWHVAQP